MQHLKPYRDKSYRFLTRPEGEALEVEVYYTKGGRNYFQGTLTASGIYVSITPVTLGGDGCMSFNLFSGISAMIRAATRKNDKLLAQVAAEVDQRIPEALALHSQDPHAAIKLLAGRAAPGGAA